ncbi:uncharacterized protein [Bemisia tabaci]|uniref:uncharacterized protein isoform X2 n=1 Tax=Bemisia tabaci TaxID=7038 RepID=UPI003B28C560
MMYHRILLFSALSVCKVNAESFLINRLDFTQDGRGIPLRHPVVTSIDAEATGDSGSGDWSSESVAPALVTRASRSGASGSMTRTESSTSKRRGFGRIRRLFSIKSIRSKPKGIPDPNAQRPARRRRHCCRRGCCKRRQGKHQRVNQSHNPHSTNNHPYGHPYNRPYGSSYDPYSTRPTPYPHPRHSPSPSRTESNQRRWEQLVASMVGEGGELMSHASNDAHSAFQDGLDPSQLRVGVELHKPQVTATVDPEIPECKCCCDGECIEMSCSAFGNCLGKVSNFIYDWGCCCGCPDDCGPIGLCLKCCLDGDGCCCCDSCPLD